MSIRAPRARLVAALGLAVVPVATNKADDARIDFRATIRPILSDTCFACHGPDGEQRKGDLRLDRKDDAFRPRDGYAILTPGDTDASELIARITSSDPSEVMPPPDAAKQLTTEQVDALKTWVAQGAEWGEHWAFVAPTKTEPPLGENPSACRNPIDAFILDRLRTEGLTPNLEADRETLIRRLTLDLNGLPPTPEEIDAFLADTSPDAYESLVDRLLNSPRYGEHMARTWLDISRYGDTHGLHLDNYREMWPYRDWVIQAFNTNIPFDRFAVEQLAGDLLPDPRLDQLIATGFNRNHVTTAEGGSIEEEVYVRNTIDRVDTTGTVFLGLTVGCARCHDHKYDPLSQKDYYQLFAFFNSIDGKPMDGNAEAHPPVVQVPTAEETAKLAALDARLAEIRTSIAGALAQISYDPAADADQAEYIKRDDFVWLDDALPPGAKPEGDQLKEGAWPAANGPDRPVFTGNASHGATAEGQAQHFFLGATPALKVGEGDVLFTYVFLNPLNPPKEIMLQWNTGEWKHRAYWGENLISFGTDGTPDRLPMGPLPPTGQWVRLEVPAAMVGIAPGTTINGIAFTQHGGEVHWDASGSFTWTPQEGRTYPTLASWLRDQKVLGDKATAPADLLAIIKKPRPERTPEELARLKAHFVEFVYAGARDVLKPHHDALAATKADRDALDKEIATTLVYREAKEPTKAFILNRGEYDQRKDEVGRETPSFLPPLPADAPRDRLGLARWLVDRSNPLTARVAVNRLWQQVFGTGLVKTVEDFGAQGEQPSHPELLDWLAVQYQDDGWDTKAFLKRLVMSATYRQSSRISPEALAKDPANILLSRGPRYRLDAETLRDQALYLGGLLVERVGGPSVKPPQPDGLWEAVAYTDSNTAKFKADEGEEKVHRRSLYTFWKRTSPPPQMTIADAPSRESCTVRRERTNTPLQALLMMNEPQYVEAARALAVRALADPAISNDEDRATLLFRRTTGRRPSTDELSILLAELTDLRAHYQANAEAARQAAGDAASVDPVELAAWTLFCNTLLNLDEALNNG